MATRSADGEDILSQVSSNDLLVRTILDNFGAKQLEEVKSVCCRWREISNNLTRNRVHFETFLLIYNPKGFRISGASEQTEGTTDGKDKRLFLNKLIKSEAVYKSDSEDSVILQLDSYFSEKLSCLPALGILFISSITLFKKLSLKTFLPLNSHQLIICSEPGIVGQSSLKSRPIELETHQLKLNAVSGSFVARQWGDFKIFLTDWDDTESPAPDRNDVNYPIKCTIIFSDEFREGNRFDSWLNSNETPIPIGGALVDGICFQKKEIKMLTISFAGKNMKAASFVMDTRRPKEAEAKLTEFKRALDFDVDDVSANVKTIGYLFICAGRGTQFYHGNLNVESNIVHTIFPHVIFSGVFGNGEYGWDCYNQPDCDKKFKSITLGDLALSYTTAMVLIQFNRCR